MEKETRTSELVVLDSSIFVDFLRGYSPAVEFFRKISSDSKNFMFSVVTKTELLSGKSCSNLGVRSKILHMLNSFIQIDVTSLVAVLAGDICREDRLTTPDAIIGASALLNDATLFTRNLKDFEGLNKKGLIIKSPY